MNDSSQQRSQVLFTLDDDDATAADVEYDREDEHTNGNGFAGGPGPKYAVGLKSSTASKEAEFDADSDDLEYALENADEASALRESGRSRPSTTHPPVPLIDRIPDRIRMSMSMDGLGEGLRAATRAVPGWDGEGLPDWLKRGAGTFNGTVNMANSILGAGVVGLPYSMRESGFFAGVGLLVALSFLTDWTIRLIVLNAKLSGRQTYIEIMEHCFGGNGKAAVSIFQFAFAFGGMCAFCVVIGDSLPHVILSVFPSLENSFLSNRQFVITAATLVISYPLSLYRNVESLSKASALALVSMVLIILTVAIRGPAMPAELRGDGSRMFTVIYPSKIIRSIAVISFAFVCHHNSLLIYGSLKEPSMDRFGRVTHYSTLIAGVAATAISIAGYWSFEEKTLSNILNNFPGTDTMVNIARFCFALNMTTTYPLETFVAREVLEEYFFQGEFDQRRHLIFTSALVVTSLVISLMTCDLGIVLELTGGLSATALAYIFPAICYLKLSRDARKTGAHITIPIEHSHGSDAAGIREADGSQGRASREGDEGDYEDEERTSVDVEEVELPLRPGAPVRHRPRMSASGERRKWWQSAQPVAAATAIFGVIVLSVSVFTAIADAAKGRGGAQHTC